MTSFSLTSQNRKLREAEALRENLRRRKDQKTARIQSSEPSSSCEISSHQKTPLEQRN